MFPRDPLRGGDGIVKSVEFVGGCSGNTQGVARLATGMRVDDVIALLSDIRCGDKTTSCPAQLASALREMRDSNA